MQTNITSFEKEKDFLVCVDSDGCAIDTMEIKHRECFGPAVLEIWPELEPLREEFLTLWNQLNLYSMTRGINRFKGLVLSFEKMAEKYQGIEDLSSLKAWTVEMTSLSNPTLEAALERTGDPVLQKALMWSQRVNERIGALQDADHPFEHVADGLATVQELADIAIVSSANGAAVDEEWTKHGLDAHVNVLCGQEAGSKAHCIGVLRSAGNYPEDRVLMIGDAPGDLAAAESNGVLFYPIIPGDEAASWKRLIDEALGRFIRGDYAGDYEKMLITAYRNALK